MKYKVGQKFICMVAYTPYIIYIRKINKNEIYLKYLRGNGFINIAEVYFSSEIDSFLKKNEWILVNKTEEQFNNWLKE